MNEDRHIILDNNMNVEPQEENIQEVAEVVETPKVEQTSKPKKEINGAVVLFILIGIVVLGSTLALFVIPLIFVKEVEPGVQENIALKLSKFDYKITLEEKYLSKLHDLKKGLMQNMFV